MDDAAFRGFEVYPAAFSPNVSKNVTAPPSDLTAEFVRSAYFDNDGDDRRCCTNCDVSSELWICMKTYKPFCSRQGNGHGVQHFEENGHCIALSLNDLSVWDYNMDR